MNAKINDDMGPLEGITITIKGRPMGKCEWKDSNLTICEGFFTEYQGVNQVVTCGNCGETIFPRPKPEPKVIIKKSGETLVAKYKGIDMFCHEPDTWWYDDFENIDLKQFAEEYEEGREAFFKIWKPISEIEITDNIAKLRPMVVECYGDIYKLLAIQDNSIIWDRGWSSAVDDFRLATVEDL